MNNQSPSPPRPSTPTDQIIHLDDNNIPQYPVLERAFMNVFDQITTQGTIEENIILEFINAVEVISPDALEERVRRELPTRRNELTIFQNIVQQRLAAAVLGEREYDLLRRLEGVLTRELNRYQPYLLMYSIVPGIVPPNRRRNDVLRNAFCGRGRRSYRP